MKLKSVMKGFYDTVRNPALRLDVVSFLRRYSVPDRILTHYACRGETTKTIVSFLKSLGFEEDADYKVIASSFDAESNSIRWIGNGRRIGELVSELSLVPAGSYAILASNLALTSDEASAFFSDRGEGSPVPSVDVYADHFLRRLSSRSDEILAALAETDEDSVEFAPNGLASFALAKAWAASVSGKPDRPFLLPIPVLEAYARTRGGCQALNGPWLFRQEDGSAVACRVSRPDDRIPAFGFLHAPVSEVLAGDDNPMKGYVYSDTDTLEKADLSDKTMCFAAVDAPMVFRSGEDLVTPVRMACGGQSLWTYVKTVLDVCYPQLVGHVGFLGQMRVAVSDFSETWNPTIGVPQCVNHGTIPARWTAGEEKMVAKAILVLSRYRLATCYSDVSEIVNTKPVVTVRKGDAETGKPDFSVEGLTVEESAWEWFAMTHGAKYNSTDSTYCYGRQPGDTENTVRNLKAFRKWKEKANGKTLAKMSCAAGNPLMTATEDTGYGSENYTPVSAFVSGAIPLALRLVNGNERLLPLKKWGGKNPELHPADVVVSNVYSGIVTDLSPALGTDDSMFPAVYAYSLRNLSGLEEGYRGKVTKWLGKLAEDGAQQVRFAQRTKGTKRTAALVVETNVDADAFFSVGLDRAEDLEIRLGTAFVQDILLRNKDPYAVTDEFLQEARSDASGHSKVRNHDKMYECLGKWRNGAFDVDGYSSLPGAVFEGGRFGDSVSVGAVKDDYGRLVLVFTAKGDVLQYARFAHRFVTEMPLATAATRVRFWQPSANEILVAPGAEGNFDTVVRFLHLQHSKYRSEDYSATNYNVPYGGSLGPIHREPFSTVPIGASPTREWFTQFGLLDAADVASE